ncbi:MAG: NUDIX hydrolase [Caldilineaceae bacterium]|nr:NUDIX hydrolase [Caldilineaceae bacterium]
MSRLLTWSRRLQALAQSGLAYATSPYDVERYTGIRRVAAEMIAAADDPDATKMEARLALEEGYATPKIDVRGACFDNGRILLVRERSDGLWTLPGGWADVHEGPRQAVEKEIREESGYEARAVKLFAVWDKEQHNHPPDLFHIWKLVLLCEIVGGAAAHSMETDGVGFFSLDNLPPLSLERITPRQIARLFALHAHPHAPTEFD